MIWLVFVANLSLLYYSQLNIFDMKIGQIVKTYSAIAYNTDGKIANNGTGFARILSFGKFWNDDIGESFDMATIQFIGGDKCLVDIEMIESNANFTFSDL